MKIDKRKFFGPLFKPLSRARHSPTTRISIALLMMPGQIIRARLNRPYFSVNLKGGRGMGALLKDAIQVCNYAEQNNLIVQLNSTNPLYSSDKCTDVIRCYFGPEGSADVPKLRPIKLQNKWDVLHLKFSLHMPIMEANRLFWTYLSPKPFIMARVNEIMDNIPNGQFNLSVHYRGTDKAREAPLAGFSIFKEEVMRYQDKHGKLDHVFLATDESAFEDYIRKEFPGIVFHTYNLGQPADSAYGRHFSDMAAEDKAIEAIVNMMLLSKAPCLIRCTSYLSAFSKIINPAIRTITLNRTHWGSEIFPEKEILAEELTEA